LRRQVENGVCTGHQGAQALEVSHIAFFNRDRGVIPTQPIRIGGDTAPREIVKNRYLV
jgi:hypothetical protein